MKEKIKKLNISSILLILFSILFLIYPSRYGIFNIKYSILILVLIIAGILLFRKIKIKINEKYYFWIILIFAIITRVSVVLLFNSKVVQVSDFGALFIDSETLIFNADKYRVFTHWILYPIILNNIYKLFGYSQLVALLTNSVILILVSLLMYKISCLLLKEKKYAFLVVLIYIFWPANIFYTLILTQEHLCSLLLLAALYLFLKLDKNDFELKNKFKQILTIIVIGVSLAISTFLKNFALVYLIAFIIYFCMQFMNKKGISKKYIFSRLIFLVILFSSFVISKNIIYLKIDDAVGEKVVRNIVPCYLNVGLRDDGIYNVGNYSMYFEKMKKYNYDEEKVNSEIVNELLDYWKNNKNKRSLLELLDSKAKIVFGGDKRINWINYSFEKTGNIEIVNFMSKYVSKINNVYFLCLVILMIFGVVRLNKEKNLQIFLSYLILFGSLLLLLLVEAQNRYMYAVQMIICILAVYGFGWFKDFVLKSLEKYNVINN